MQGLPRRYLLSSVVYLSALLLLLGLALLAASFTRTVGIARISGRFSPFPLFNRTSLQSLTVSWHGLDLRFSRPAPAGVLRFEASAGAADIIEGDARLRVSLPGDQVSALTISQVPDTGAASMTALTIAFRISGIVEEDLQGDTLSWRTGGETFELSLPPGANIDYRARTISFPLGGSRAAMRLVALSPSARVEAPSRAARLPDEKSLPTQEQLAAAIARFSDLAFAGWTGARYSANKGTWRMADGSQAFSEDIGIGLLAESVARGTFSDGLQDWSSALDNRLEQSAAPMLSFSACVYTGTVKDFARRQQDRDSADVDRLTTLSARADASLTDQPGVLRYLLDRGGPAAAKSVLSAFRRFDVARLSLSEALTCLEVFEDYVQLVGDDPTVAVAARDLVHKRLVPSVAATDEGTVFLRSSDSGSIDVKQSIRCGVLLSRAGSLSQDSAINALGRGLIASCISLADNEGFLPVTLSLAQGRLASRDGALAPESIYAMLPSGKHIPREIPLYRFLGPGGWVWTAADLVSADQADDAVRLVFSYPTGVPHYLVFRGLRPFTQIRLHNIPWHSDPAYARYSDGWDYDGQNRTLFMKMTGKQDQEEVDIRFSL